MASERMEVSSACLGTDRVRLWMENRRDEMLCWVPSGVEDGHRTLCPSNIQTVGFPPL